MSFMTHMQRVESARKTGIYEPLRERMQYLLDEGYTYAQVARIMRISNSKVKVAIVTLSLEVGRGRRERDDSADRESEAASRAIELSLVAAIRHAYGPIGRGFSTA